MYCKHCGNKISETAKFCSKCGTKIIFESNINIDDSQKKKENITQESKKLISDNVQKDSNIKTMATMFDELELFEINKAGDRRKGLEYLAFKYYKGEDSWEQDDKRALLIARIACREGNDNIASFIGDCYINGQGDEVDYRKAFFYHLRAAKSGVAKSQFCIGEFYANENASTTNICPCNQYIAHCWYEKAANGGYAKAMSRVADDFREGNGTVMDLEQAYIWYERAAKKGNVLAMYNFAVFCHGAAGIKFQDENLAGYWFNEAAKQGHIDAQEALKCYQYSSSSEKWKKRE